MYITTVATKINKNTLLTVMLYERKTFWILKNKFQNDDIDEKVKLKVYLENVIQDMPEPDKFIYQTKDLMNRAIQRHSLVKHMKNKIDRRELISIQSLRR